MVLVQFLMSLNLTENIPVLYTYLVILEDKKSEVKVNFSGFLVLFLISFTRKRELWNLKSVHHLGLVARKPVFGVSDKARLKPVSSGAS